MDVSEALSGLANDMQGICCIHFYASPQALLSPIASLITLSKRPHEKAASCHVIDAISMAMRRASPSPAQEVVGSPKVASRLSILSVWSVLDLISTNDIKVP